MSKECVCIRQSSVRNLLLRVSPLLGNLLDEDVDLIFCYNPLSYFHEGSEQLVCREILFYSNSVSRIMKNVFLWSSTIMHAEA